MIQVTPERIDQFEQALLTLDRSKVNALLHNTDGQPLPLQDIEAMIVPALEHIGNGWEEGRVALSQVYMSGRLCEEFMDNLLPVDTPPTTIVPGIAITVLEDYHFLGMRIVSSVLRACGYSLLSYGRQEVHELVTRVREDNIRILLISVLMLRSAMRVRELRHQLDEICCPVKLVVGGAPFRLDDQLWKKVGADATANTAAGAISILQQMLKDDALCKNR